MRKRSGRLRIDLPRPAEQAPSLDVLKGGGSIYAGENAMKTSSTRLVKSALAAFIAATALSACTYHRTVVERPAATGTTVVVPDNDRRDVIVVPKE
jgi:hypothetical protein